jgi:hypothetical protein
MGGNAVPFSLGSPQIPRRMSWNLSRASVVRGRRISASAMARTFPNEGSSKRLRLCVLSRQQTKRKFVSSARKSVKIGYSTIVTIAWSAKRKSYHLPDHLHHVALIVSPAFTHLHLLSSLRVAPQFALSRTHQRSPTNLTRGSISGRCDVRCSTVLYNTFSAAYV